MATKEFISASSSVLAGGTRLEIVFEAFSTTPTIASPSDLQVNITFPRATNDTGTTFGTGTSVARVRKATIANGATECVVTCEIDDTVYDLDTTTISVPAGWLTQGSDTSEALSNEALVNDSAAEYPTAMAAWAVTPHNTYTGLFSLEAFATHKYGIRSTVFTVNDGIASYSEVGARVSRLDEMPQGVFRRPYSVFRADFQATEMNDTETATGSFVVVPNRGPIGTVFQTENYDETNTYRPDNDNFDNAPSIEELRFAIAGSGVDSVIAFVDPVNGSDSTGSSDENFGTAIFTPFKTIHAAIADLDTDADRGLIYLQDGYHRQGLKPTDQTSQPTETPIASSKWLRIHAAPNARPIITDAAFTIRFRDVDEQPTFILGAETAGGYLYRVFDDGADRKITITGDATEFTLTLNNYNTIADLIPALESFALANGIDLKVTPLALITQEPRFLSLTDGFVEATFTTPSTVNLLTPNIVEVTDTNNGEITVSIGGNAETYSLDSYSTIQGLVDDIENDFPTVFIEILLPDAEPEALRVHYYETITSDPLPILENVSEQGVNHRYVAWDGITFYYVDTLNNGDGRAHAKFRNCTFDRLPEPSPYTEPSILTSEQWRGGIWIDSAVFADLQTAVVGPIVARNIRCLNVFGEAVVNAAVIQNLSVDHPVSSTTAAFMDVSNETTVPPCFWRNIRFFGPTSGGDLLQFLGNTDAEFAGLTVENCVAVENGSDSSLIHANIEQLLVRHNTFLRDNGSEYFRIRGSSRDIKHFEVQNNVVTRLCLDTMGATRLRASLKNNEITAILCLGGGDSEVTEYFSNTTGGTFETLFEDYGNLDLRPRLGGNLMSRLTAAFLIDDVPLDTDGDAISLNGSIGAFYSPPAPFALSLTVKNQITNESQVFNLSVNNQNVYLDKLYFDEEQPNYRCTLRNTSTKRIHINQLETSNRFFGQRVRLSVERDEYEINGVENPDVFATNRTDLALLPRQDRPVTINPGESLVFTMFCGGATGSEWREDENASNQVGVVGLSPKTEPGAWFTELFVGWFDEDSIVDLPLSNATTLEIKLASANRSLFVPGTVVYQGSTLADATAVGTVRKARRINPNNNTGVILNVTVDDGEFSDSVPLKRNTTTFTIDSLLESDPVSSEVPAPGDIIYQVNDPSVDTGVGNAIARATVVSYNSSNRTARLTDIRGNWNNRSPFVRTEGDSHFLSTPLTGSANFFTIGSTIRIFNVKCIVKARNTERIVIDDLNDHMWMGWSLSASPQSPTNPRGFGWSISTDGHTRLVTNPDWLRRELNAGWKNVMFWNPFGNNRPGDPGHDNTDIQFDSWNEIRANPENNPIWYDRWFDSMETLTTDYPEIKLGYYYGTMRRDRNIIGRIREGNPQNFTKYLFEALEPMVGGFEKNVGLWALDVPFQQYTYGPAQFPRQITGYQFSTVNLFDGTPATNPFTEPGEPRYEFLDMFRKLYQRTYGSDVAIEPRAPNTQNWWHGSSGFGSFVLEGTYERGNPDWYGDARQTTTGFIGQALTRSQQLALPSQGSIPDSAVGNQRMFRWFTNYSTETACWQTAMALATGKLLAGVEHVVVQSVRNWLNSPTGPRTLDGNDTYERSFNGYLQCVQDILDEITGH